MVLKQPHNNIQPSYGFRSMSSQMVLKLRICVVNKLLSFRSMSSQMVLKLTQGDKSLPVSFRSMSSQMVLKQILYILFKYRVLDLCHLKWY